nr:hypothetical protein [Tanacetum cinerariifolium]
NAACDQLVLLVYKVATIFNKVNTEVILNGDSPPPTRSVDGVETTYPSTTAEEKLARRMS